MASRDENPEVLAASSRNLTTTEVHHLEAILQKHPDDLTTRTKLLGYYAGRRYSMPDNKGRAQFEKQVLWIIKNRPDAEIAGGAYTDLDPITDPTAYPIGRTLWLNHIKTDPNNTQVLLHAANYFLINEPQISEKLFTQGQRLEPTNSVWPIRLAQIYELKMQNNEGSEHVAAAKKATELLQGAQRLSNAPVYVLADLARVAYEAQEFDKARTYAKQLLQTANGSSDWNAGNDMYRGNTILGLLALHDGNLDQAKSYLLAAGKTTGSPQLDTFGPNMTLAKELLIKGEKQTVLQFFQECNAFWENSSIPEWTKEVKNGAMPDFGGNLAY
jgi:tetratricopeptide (TPR) repeat protein